MRFQIVTGRLDMPILSKITGVISGLMFGSMMLFSAQASAECACFCVSGELQTMCSSVEEAQDNPSLCSAYQDRSCPSESGNRTSSNYDAPAEGATNCRDIRVFDSLRGVFTDVKACDVLDAS